MLRMSLEAEVSMGCAICSFLSPLMRFTSQCSIFSLKTIEVSLNDTKLVTLSTKANLGEKQNEFSKKKKPPVGIEPRTS